MQFCKKVILVLAALVVATLVMPSRLWAVPSFIIGLTTRAELTRDLGNPIAEIRFADGITRVRWPRTVFSGVDVHGNRISTPMSFYDCEFRPDNVLSALRPVDTSISLDSPLFLPDHIDPASIHGAAKGGNLEGIKALLQANPDLVSSKGNKSRTPLDYAAHYDHKDVAELLLAKGADVNAREDDGRTPLQEAAMGGAKAVAELLLAKGADVNARDNDGCVALDYAAANGHKDVAELLLSNKAELDTRDNNGQTPLYKAAGEGHKDVVELLLAKGADVNAKNITGKTPLWVAMANKNAMASKNKDVVEVLRRHGGRK